MMAHRHKKKGEGGGVAPKHDPNKLAYTGKGSHVEKEAKEENRGGKVTKKATGGKVEQKAVGGAAKPRLDKRARGGSVAAGKVREGGDMTTSPFSAAHVKGHMGAASHPHPHKGK
jgi:hypothetical protein